ncbi:hypothetical protein CFOL_v3_04805 [Cephalotus follicularis]|uniref:Uncharacterized protein n=1 Tax=Cephalotus follicularis TaxID=3775 RepID=A0A1Q3AZV1_CEPFO|nr:hypothetical protein CFOL_v3_04805 [Cephalotus follicularis]
MVENFWRVKKSLSGKFQHYIKSLGFTGSYPNVNSKISVKDKLSQVVRSINWTYCRCHIFQGGFSDCYTIPQSSIKGTWSNKQKMDIYNQRTRKGSVSSCCRSPLHKLFRS